MSPSADDDGLKLRFGMAALATWRVTHLLVREDGPADAIARTREWLGESRLGALMDCFYCTSMWVAIPFAFFVAKKPVGRVTAWLALSGIACLIDERMEKEDEERNGGVDGLLRAKTSGI
ncbi:MAG TPA: DUF1360 domain-containing protein [Terracidiphilus sp.]|nr:DUF1360 domain-containing protein [Terracidiphilus sp.]